MPDAALPAPLTKPRMGLLAAASVTESQTARGGGRWGWPGISWRPVLVDEASDAIGVRELACSTSSVGVTGAPVNEEAYGLMVYARDSCSTMNDADLAGSPADRQARARQLLEATKSAQIAEEFWVGTMSDAQSLTNTWLKKTGSTAVTSGATAPQKALAKLDQAIATNLSNGRGMIHCRVEVLDRLNDTQSIRREGNLWLTPFDNIVVADAGYDGTGSVAGEWMFATTPVEIYLGPVRVSDPGIESTIRSTNDVHVWAQQDFIVLHDPHLLWHRAQVDLT